MKKNFLLLCAFIISCALNAQKSNIPPESRIVDLSTGQNTTVPGDPDPIWVRSTPGPGSSVAERALSRFTTSSCTSGEWIEPLAGPNGIGDLFRTVFYYTQTAECLVTQVNIDIEAWGDNYINAMQYNGQNVVFTPGNPKTFSANNPAYHTGPLPPPIGHTNIGPAGNSLEIEVLNSSAKAGLKVCGEVEFLEVCCDPGTPKDLTLTGLSPVGNYKLSWTDNTVLPNTNHFQIEIRYNDYPYCTFGCNGPPTTVYVNGIGSGNTSYTFVPAYPCFSWKVRAYCAKPNPNDNVFGDWSATRYCEMVVLPLPPPQPKLKSPTLEGIDALNEEKSISVLPNPSTGLFNLNITGYNQFEYHVTDINGKQIIDRTTANGNSVEVDLTQQPDGMYFLNVRSEEHVERIKMLKGN